MVDIFVDSAVTGPGSGTEIDPYKTLAGMWAGESFVGGNTYNIYCRTSDDSTADTTVVAMTGAHSGTGDITWNFLPWEDFDGSVNDGRNLTSTLWLSTKWRHDPIPASGDAITIDSTYTGGDLNFNFSKLQFRVNHSTSNSLNLCNIGNGNNGADINVSFSKCRVFNDDDGQGATFDRVFRLRQDCKSLTLKNNLIYGGQSQINCSASWSGGTTQVKIYCNHLIRPVGTATTSYTQTGTGFNVVSKGNFIEGAGGAGSVDTISYNASDQAGDRTNNGVTIIAGDLVSLTGTPPADSNDWSPNATAGPQPHEEAAQGNSIDSEYPTDDILDATRSLTATTMGAFASLAGETPGGVAFVPNMMIY